MPSVSAAATAKNAPAGPSTRERLLSAAASVFAQQGLMAATTRGIAEAAGVNEVTLFRLFKNKQNLLTAVIERVFAVAPSEPTPSPHPPTRPEGGPLWQLVWDYANFYRARLGRNVRLIRVLIGEIQHCDEHARKIVHGVFHPQRQQFIDRLREAQGRGHLHPASEPDIIADQLGGMILTSVLRSDMPVKCNYSDTRYLKACVETITRANAPAAKDGLAAEKTERPRKTGGRSS